MTARETVTEHRMPEKWRKRRPPGVPHLGTPPRQYFTIYGSGGALHALLYCTKPSQAAVRSPRCLPGSWPFTLPKHCQGPTDKTRPRNRLKSHKNAQQPTIADSRDPPPEPVCFQFHKHRNKIYPKRAEGLKSLSVVQTSSLLAQQAFSGLAVCSWCPFLSEEGQDTSKKNRTAIEKNRTAIAKRT